MIRIPAYNPALSSADIYKSRNSPVSLFFNHVTVPEIVYWEQLVHMHAMNTKYVCIRYVDILKSGHLLNIAIQLEALQKLFVLFLFVFQCTESQAGSAF